MTWLALILTVLQVVGHFKVYAVKGKSLEINFGETLIINTSELKAKYEEDMIDLTVRDDTATIGNDNYSYSVAVLMYEKNITFHAGSTVTVEGKRALSIQSQTGNITIETTISMTCKTVPSSSKTCLGGYTKGNKTNHLGDHRFEGRGPGKSSIHKIAEKCNSGAGHGGQGGGKNDKKGKTYGKDDFKSLIGGSAGISNDSNNLFVGGGAIEIIATNGTVLIGAMITASAVARSNNIANAIFSGSSGGLIRIIANKIKMTTMASLNVNGADASKKLSSGSEGNGGGGGGIIQIKAADIQLYNLSMAEGSSQKCNATGVYDLAGNGCLVILRDLADESNITKCDQSLKFYTWNTDAKLKQILETILKLKEKFSVKNLTDFIAVLNQLEKIVTMNNLDRNTILIVVEIFDNGIPIVEVISHHMPEIAKDVLSLILKIATFAVAPNNLRNWKETRKMPKLASILEEIAMQIANVTSEYQNYTDTIAIQSRPLRVDSKPGYRFPVYSDLPANFLASSGDYVYIPKESLPKPTGEYKVVTLLYRNIQEGLPELNDSHKIQGSDPHRVVSLLASYSLLHNGQILKKLSSPAHVHFNLYEQEKYRENAKCSYWNRKNESWDSEGLSVQDTNTSHTVCETTHFTSFAVLMQFTPIPMTEAEELALSLITYIGCGISTATLLIALFIFLSIEALSTERHRIHLNLIMALFMAQVLFLTGIKATGEEVLCKVIAGALHYFYTASFTWMLIEGVHLYLKVVKVFGIENVKLRQYYIIGWGLPILIVGAAVAIKPYNYGTKFICWLSMEDSFVWAFIGPVLAIIAVNCFILAVVIKTVITSAATFKSSDLSHIKAGVKGALVLMPLMGVTWIFGLLAVNRDTLIFQYVFAIANSLQGFFIFLLHIVFNNEVRTAFQRKREKKQLSKDSDYKASYTSTHESDRRAMWSNNKGSSSSSSSNSLSGFRKLKARLSFGITKTTRVISVQPMSDNQDGSLVRIDRSFQNKTPPNSGLSGPAEQELASLHCPASLDAEPNPPSHNQINCAKPSDNRL